MEVVTNVKIFLEPLVVAIFERERFYRHWTAPGPWR